MLAFTEVTCLWEAPVAMPQDGKAYVWDEAALAWLADVDVQIAAWKTEG